MNTAILKQKSTGSISKQDKKNVHEEYTNLLESNFEHWEKVKSDNKKLSKENQNLRKVIYKLLDEFKDRVENKKKRKDINQTSLIEIPIKIIREYFIPNIRPDIVNDKIGLSSAVFLVKKTEEYKLFNFPELVIRVPRTSKNKGKHETTVLYSLMGVIVLTDLIKKEVRKMHDQTPEVSDEEQVEIEKMFTQSKKKELFKHVGKTIKDFEITEIN